MNLIRASFIPHCLFVCFVAAVSCAQQPANPIPAASSASSTSAPAKKDSAGSERVVLKVGNMQVTQGEFESRINDIEPQGGDPDEKGATEKDRKRLGDDYASVLMLSQQAVANHLESSPEVARQLAVARMQVLSDAEFASLMHEAKPSFEEVSQYYSAHLADYDQVHIRRLFIWKQKDKGGPALSREAAKERAERVCQAYAAGTGAQKLADVLNKSGDGMLDVEPVMFPRGELKRHMETVAFGLKEGEWGEVEDTPASLLLIQLVKRDRQQIGEVSSYIEKDLQAKKMQALLDDLKKKAGIWMDEQYFGTAVAPVPDAQRRASNPPSELHKSANMGDSNK
ncbi:MAG TPA: peptidyl-prolyl cis-trans isomerase [Terriglobales bacterium]|nr:peptidyl-prolyl cis-trans isomerase [Terriglobales bacterium]